LKTALRLENILCEYEDLVWLKKLIHRTHGSMVNIPEPGLLREALNNRDLAVSMKVCSDLFDAGDEFKFGLDQASDIADWCHHSKRVFSISSSLCNMLLETELPDFSSNGVKFVARSYVVHLQEPVKTSDGRAHDFILCSYIPNSNALSIRSYPSTYDDYKPLDDKVKKEMERHAEKGNKHFRKFVDQCQKSADRRFVVGYTCFFNRNQSMKQSVISGAPDDEKEDWELIYKLALGVNLYLQSARGDDHEKLIHVTGVSKKTKQSISEGATLFQLSVSKAFSSRCDEGSTGGGDSGTVRPHFRRGYWRRESGHGNDPEAIPTIWVRPTWVRADKIAEGEKPIGNQQSVRPVDG
jgi:hypothetical protein